MSALINLTWGGNFKSIGDEGILEGDAIVFGSEESPDISSFKDFFTQDTTVHPDDQFKTTLFMEHGFSYRKPIGSAVMSKTEKGWIATAQLNMQNPIVKSRFSEIKNGGWGFSTGAVGHVVEREAKANGTHFISQWTVGELSITRTPAEPKALIHAVKSLDDYYTTSQDIMPMDNMPMDDTLEEDNIQLMNENLMQIIEMLISQLTKKNIEEFLSPQLEEIKTKLVELKSTSLPIGSEEQNEKLTVLKSENEEIKLTLEELQSSFNEKEALLSEKMALLSEIQEQLDKSDDESIENPVELLIKMKEKWIIDFGVLEEEVAKSKELVDSSEKKVQELTSNLEESKKINLILGRTNFKK